MSIFATTTTTAIIKHYDGWAVGCSIVGMGREGEQTMESNVHAPKNKQCSQLRMLQKKF